MHKNLSVRLKILVGFLIVIIVSCSSAVFIYISINGVQTSSSVQTERMLDVQRAQNLLNMVGMLYSNQADLIINNNPDIIKEYEQNAKGFKILVSQVNGAVDTVEEKQWGQELVIASDKYTAQFNDIVAMFNRQSSMTTDKLRDEYKILDDQTDVIKNEIFTLANNFINSYENEYKEANENLNIQISNSIKTAILTPIIIAILGIVFALITASSIYKPVNELVVLARKISTGDLTTKIVVKSKDEIGQLAQAMNSMVENMRILIGKVASNAISVAAASQQISASTEEIASGSTSQANAAQNMNELFKELSVAINSVARSAEQASELSDRTMSIAQEGGKVVNNSIQGMNRVNQQMSRLEEDSNKIGEIIEVIDDIADQTNLLALNAAIEAARAGDQGRGFAVVADEVRKLAERSSEATKQITSIIKGMQDNTQESVKAVLEGVTSSQQTGDAFESIISMVNQSGHKVTEIAAASEEQAAQSSEVMASIESISAATEEAAASSEETASTAQSLAQLAEQLNNTVSTFKINSPY